MTDKPPYRVPSMAEIRDIPWNGFNAVSTFSGCGGSSLGYRMAGFRMLWANEFIPAAQETYRANSSPRTILDTRDIRTVSGAELLETIGLDVGEIDLFDGSPPCASFSTAGKREKGWGREKQYSDTVQRADDLFFEYIRLIRDTQPRTFVAENVSGLVKGTAKGYFKLILASLRECGYRVEARLLDASWLGVPQARQRLIFMGVREDLDMRPVFPKPLPYRYVVRDALPAVMDKGRFVHDTSGRFSLGDVTDRPSPTITVGMNSINANHYRILAALGSPGITHDPETGESIMLTGKPVEKLWREIGPGENHDRRINLNKMHPDRPSRTISAADGSNVGTASITHWAAPRKLTLGELRRLCSFPDDFVLTGSFKQRWERLGRAVPPVMMSHIAATVRDEVLSPLREQGVI